MVTNSTSAMVLPIGSTLQDSKYQLVGILSNGGYGQTYKAKYHPLDQTVIVKTLNRNHGLPFSLKQRSQQFITEARHLAQYQHPQIVRVRDLFVESNLPFVVMDYVPGATLSQLAAHQPLPEAVAVDYVRQIADAIAAIHQAGQLHKIICPDNVMVWNHTQTVILTDFGLGRHLTPEFSPINSRVLATGYAAIEQYSPQHAWTPATDVYALAATLYTLLTGQIPVSSIQREQTSFHTPRQLKRQLSSTVERAVVRGMAMRPQDRPQTVTEWLTLLPTHKSQRYALPYIDVVAGIQGSDRPSGDESHTNPKGRSKKSQTAPNQSSCSPSSTEQVTKTPVRPMPHLFPKRVLAWSALIAGFTGLSFGLLLRYHFTQQFANSEGLDQNVQTLEFEPPNQNGELFLPKRTPSLTEADRSTEPSPEPTQPVPTPLDPPTSDIEFPEASSPLTTSPTIQPDPAYNPSGPQTAEIYNPSFPDARSLPPDDSSGNYQAPATNAPAPPTSPERSFSSPQSSTLDPAIRQPAAGSDPYSAPLPPTDLN